jgi:DNA-binding NtrC family response regulator
MILLDYQLGDDNGLEVLKKIKSYDPDIHVVFLSGQKKVDVAVDSLKYGSIDYVVKDEMAMSQLTEIMHRLEKLSHAIRIRFRSKRIKQLMAGIILIPALIGLTYYFFS